MKCVMGGPPMIAFSHGQAARATRNSSRSRQERDSFLFLRVQSLDRQGWISKKDQGRGIDFDGVVRVFSSIGRVLFVCPGLVRGPFGFVQGHADRLLLFKEIFPIKI
jgi:hypothetical protein